MITCLKIEIFKNSQIPRDNLLLLLNQSNININYYIFSNVQNKEILNFLEEKNIKPLPNDVIPDFIININEDYEIKKLPLLNLKNDISIYLKSIYQNFTFYFPFILSGYKKEKLYVSDDYYLQIKNSNLAKDYFNDLYQSFNLPQPLQLEYLEKIKYVYPSSLEISFYLSKLYIQHKRYNEAFNEMKDFVNFSNFLLKHPNPPKDTFYQEDIYNHLFLELFSVVCFHLEKYNVSKEICTKLLTLNLNENKKDKIKSNLNLINNRLPKEEIKSLEKLNENLPVLCFFVGYTMLIENGNLIEKIFGSELALFSLINELKDKFNIIISGQNIPGNFLINNIRYISIDTFRNFKNFFQREIDYLVISRYINYFIDVEHSAKNTYLWLHDTCIHSAFNGIPITSNSKYFFKNICNKIDKIVVLSDWHLSIIQSFYNIPPNKLEIIGNATHLEKFQINKVKQKNKFIWLSEFNRGLEPLLKFFPKIHEKFPEAELHIFRDFKDHPSLLEEANKYPFFKVRGFQKNEIIIQELLSSDFWLYPTNFSETYCISALEAQAAGCIPIATDLAALKDTIQDRGFLIKEELYSQNYWDKILEVIQELNQNQELKETKRRICKEWAKEQTWINRSERWLEVFGIKNKIKETQDEDKGKDKIKETQDKDKIKVKLLTNWCSTEELVNGWKKLCKNSKDGIYDNIQITTKDDADYFAVFNFNFKDFYVPEKTILLRMEPKAIQNFHPELWVDERQDNKKYFHIFKEHNPIEWHLSKTYQELKKDLPLKYKTISTVVSSEYNLEGHRKRIDFLKYCQTRNEIEIDIYGKSNKFNFNNYKGSLPLFRKDEGLMPYKYTIACENSCEPGYFTEKLADSILSECLCFYWGCPNISEFIDSKAIIILDLDNFEKGYQQIKEAIENNEWEKRITFIRKEKEKILDRYNILSILNKIINYSNFEIKVINLKRREDRWEKFVKNYQGILNNHFQRFDATDGSQLVLNGEYKKIFEIPFNFRGKRYPSLTHNYQRAVIGTCLSHLRLWEELIKSNKEYNIILEDDVILPINFMDRWRQEYNSLKSLDWDIVFLGFNDDVINNKDIYLNKTLKKFTDDVNRKMGGGAYGYVISKSGANKLVNKVRKDGIQVPIDHFIIDNFDLINCYILQPHLVKAKVFGQEGNFDTDIQNDFNKVRIE